MFAERNNQQFALDVDWYVVIHKKREKIAANPHI